jgi:hypothetical protein
VIVVNSRKTKNPPFWVEENQDILQPKTKKNYMWTRREAKQAGM